MFTAHPGPILGIAPGSTSQVGVSAPFLGSFMMVQLSRTLQHQHSAEPCVLLTVQPSLHVHTQSLPAAGTGDTEYLAATSDALDRAFSEFRPDVLLYNAGEHVLPRHVRPLAPGTMCSMRQRAECLYKATSSTFPAEGCPPLCHMCMQRVEPVDALSQLDAIFSGTQQKSRAGSQAQTSWWATRWARWRCRRLECGAGTTWSGPRRRRPASPSSWCCLAAMPRETSRSVPNGSV